MALTVGSLFSGIGGIDLGLERAGMVTRWFVEIDPHCRNVLARHWPGLPVYGDITEVDWSGVEPVDVLAGGFPCQPISAAGLRRAQADERWLWPQFGRAIRELRPRYVLVENVRNLLAVNGGSAFAEVLGDLAALGYDAEWDCIPASAVGAPHQRDRLWLVAYPTGERWAGRRAGHERRDNPASHADRRGKPAGSRSGRGAVADAEGERPSAGPLVALGSPAPPEPQRPSADSDPVGERLEGLFTRWPAPGSADGSGDGSDPSWWAVEPDVGRVADGVPHRVDRLRALGNAVVPQVVEWIGRRIVAFDEGRVA